MMISQELKDFTFKMFLDIGEDFFILLAIVLVCEWYAGKKGYNMFERAWLITVMILLFLVSFGWYTFGKHLIWL
jgi:hypothetical protein